MKNDENKLDPRSVRKKLGLNQLDFWARLGVTQSGGSRYESGRNMPRPVQELFRVTYIENLDLSKIKREDFLVIEYLKENDAAYYRELKKAAKLAHKLKEG